MTVRRSARAIAAGLVAAAAVALPATAAADGRPWMNAGLSPDARADLLLPAMTQDEKFALMAGACDPRGHTGFVAGIPRLGIPDLYLNDGPAGVHEEPPTTYSQEPGGTCATFQYGEVGPGHATAMPAPIALAATFDDRLANAYGTVVGDEAAKKQNQVIFGPDVNVMRDPRGGRTFEAYGEDPYLASRMAVGWIDGLQAQHVIADVKHYAANNEESGRQSSDSIVDERTLREIELPAFEAAVKQAHVGTVMAAYNKVDGTYMTENDLLLNGVLKRDWGFDGWVLTDYGAQHSTVAAANGGTDMELPYHEFYDGRALAAAVASGQIGQATIDDHVLRILRTEFRFGLFDHPEWWKPRPIDFAANGATAERIEQNAIVLLRNQRRVLPLTRAVHSIAVIGADATVDRSGGGSSKITADHTVAPLDAITARAGARTRVTFDDGSDPTRAAAAAKTADVAIVFAYDAEGEGNDRACMSLECSSDEPDQDGLIEKVAAANPHTIVVLTTGSPELLPWTSKVAGIVEAWYPGEEGGTALARMLFGDTDAEGRLPVTFAAHAGDVPASTPEQWPGTSDEGAVAPIFDVVPPPGNVLPPKSIYYTEGVLAGYRWYDARHIAPAFPFGFGLSYTRWRYSQLRTTRDRVAVTVTNAGRRAGADVAQLYVRIPSPAPGVVEPPQQLKGFQKVRLRAGRSQRVTFHLDDRSFAYWDATRHAWTAQRGCYRVYVARSSRDIVGRATVPHGVSRC